MPNPNITIRNFFTAGRRRPSQLNDFRYLLVPAKLSDEKFWRVYLLLITKQLDAGTRQYKTHPHPHPELGLSLTLSCGAVPSCSEARRPPCDLASIRSTAGAQFMVHCSLS